MQASDIKIQGAREHNLQEVDVLLPRNQLICLTGVSGSGKSTLSDIVMGLLKPTQGTILVDGEDLYNEKYPERLSYWRNLLSHLDQFLNCILQLFWILSTDI